MMSRRAAADDKIDGCDLDFAVGPLTSDVDLPPAQGGVEPVRRTRRRT
jgi:hypothetical protein